MGGMNAGYSSLIWPVLVQVVLTFTVLGLMARARVGALKGREVKMGEVAVGNDAWPSRVKQVSNNFSNQFETPVLFYVLVFLAIHVGATGPVMTGLAWAYVVSRIVHAYIHIGTNNVRHRFNAFLVGVLVLMAMTVSVIIGAI
ncbi:MAG: MAPEG family protein [Alphaproteobacteria bacterium]